MKQNPLTFPDRTVPMFVRAIGVTRMADNDKAVLVTFAEPLADHQLRGLHDLLQGIKLEPLRPTEPYRRPTCARCGVVMHLGETWVASTGSPDAYHVGCKPFEPGEPRP